VTRRRNLDDLARHRRPALVAGGPGSDNPAVVRLREYYQDPRAPLAHDLLPAVFAAVRSPTGEVLLVRRIDDGNWELPGGRIEVGETVQQALIREVAEESGIPIDVTTLSGVYSDPSHVLLDPDGSVHQQLALCYHAVPAPGGGAHPRTRPRPDGIETDAARWCALATLTGLVMHPAMRLRLHNAVTAPQQVHHD
jgi:8-oxo-dGTP pyrophosphatase MutT (NUDIX family)